MSIVLHLITSMLVMEVSILRLNLFEKDNYNISNEAKELGST